MVSSCGGVSRVPSSVLPLNLPARSLTKVNKDWNISFLIPVAFVVFAIAYAPESPEQLASICEKHNPAIACQVW